MFTIMVPNLNDADLSLLLTKQTDIADDSYLFVLNAYTVASYVRKLSEQWNILAYGELGNETIKTLKQPLKKGRVFWIQCSEAQPEKYDFSNDTPACIDEKQLKGWLARLSAIAGRNAEPPAKIKQLVGCLAGWHCQFDGCGENLYTSSTPGSNGNYSYFAHIVASSPDGPRGDKDKSSKLAQDPQNLMLLCDKHHRLIDRIAADRYPASLLNEMRSNNIAEVARILGTLKFAVAQPIIVTHGIEGQGGVIDEKLIQEAMWLEKLRPVDIKNRHFMKLGNISSSNNPAYWSNCFQALKNDIPSLLRLLRGEDSNDGKPSRLAVFGIHGTSVLITLGRLIGEASSIKLFQFNRNQIDGRLGGQWAWSNLEAPKDDKFKIITEHPFTKGDCEAVLRVNLTAPVEAAALPAYLYTNGSFTKPAIKITLDNPSNASIGHPNDLMLLGKAIDVALRTIQDEWKIRKVHLIVVAPVSACVRVGQKMQARNQSEFTLYERNPGIDDNEFKPTITLTSTHVRNVSSAEEIDIR